MAGYSTELGNLRNKLNEEPTPEDFADRVHHYLGEKLSPHEDPREFGMEWLARAKPQWKDDFMLWRSNDYGSYDHNLENTNAPLSTTMEYEGAKRPEWLVHGTDEGLADKIVQEGFQYGHRSPDGVHLTTRRDDRATGPGFNFAYPTDTKHTSNPYGNEAVVFPSGSIEVNHYGDRERQRIFWGPHVPPDNIFAIHRDENNRKWYVKDQRGRILIKDKTYREAVEYVQNNYRMLQNIRDKEKRKLKQQGQ